MEQKQFESIKKWLQEADALIINTGAGMGIDSGLADYRGSGGQWGQVETETGENIFDVMNPKSLISKPDYIWQLFAKRIKEYAETEPHLGFHILKNWIEKFNLDYFVITSNIDGHFQKVGFAEDKIRELHGSISHFQCSVPCSKQIWEVDFTPGQLEEKVKHANYPTCPHCGKMARPNIYMFRDNTYLPDRDNEQKLRFNNFLGQNEGKSLLVFEIGSGPHVQSIRKKTRELALKHQAKVVRINPKDEKIKEPHIGLAMGALEALKLIDEGLKD